MKRVRYRPQDTEQDASKEYLSQPNLPTRKHQLDLPKIRRRAYFTDDISVSEDYIRISERTPADRKLSKVESSRSSQNHGIKTSRTRQ